MAEAEAVAEAEAEAGAPSGDSWEGAFYGSEGAASVLTSSAGEHGGVGSVGSCGAAAAEAAAQSTCGDAASSAGHDAGDDAGASEQPPLRRDEVSDRRRTCESRSAIWQRR
jgi:hypothetical protein